MAHHSIIKAYIKHKTVKELQVTMKQRRVPWRQHNQPRILFVLSGKGQKAARDLCHSKPPQCTEQQWETHKWACPCGWEQEFSCELGSFVGVNNSCSSSSLLCAHTLHPFQQVQSLPSSRMDLARNLVEPPLLPYSFNFKNRNDQEHSNTKLICITKQHSHLHIYS